MGDVGKVCGDEEVVGMKVLKILGLLAAGYVACSWVYWVWAAWIPVPAEFAECAGRLRADMEFRDVLQVFDGYAVIVAKSVKADLAGCDEPTNRRADEPTKRDNDETSGGGQARNS